MDKLISKKNRKKLYAALFERAVGYRRTEVTEEETPDEENGGFKVVKRKITSKISPPDLTAVKILLDACAADTLADMSEEELLAERERLLKILKERN